MASSIPLHVVQAFHPLGLDNLRGQYNAPAQHPTESNNTRPEESVDEPTCLVPQKADTRVLGEMGVEGVAGTSMTGACKELGAVEDGVSTLQLCTCCLGLTP